MIIKRVEKRGIDNIYWYWIWLVDDKEWLVYVTYDGPDSQLSIAQIINGVVHGAVDTYVPLDVVKAITKQADNDDIITILAQYVVL